MDYDIKFTGYMIVPNVDDAEQAKEVFYETIDRDHVEIDPDKIEEVNLIN